MTIQYTRELDRRITNIDALPRGLNCKYLLCIRGEDDMLIAHSWKRKEVKKLNEYQVLIKFGK